jgi:hypothetical protein
MNHVTTVRRILTNAAKLVARSTPDKGYPYSCLALTEAAGRVTGEAWGVHGEAAREHYENLFSPYRFGHGVVRGKGRGRRPLGSASFWDVNPHKVDNKQARVDALLFAAASYA